MGGPTKGRSDHVVLGDWNVACSMCGRKRKSSQMVRNWQGMWRCPEHNEPRQPQDFVRNVPDVQSVPFAQPETDFDVPTVCEINKHSAISNYALPGCIYPDVTAIP
jgi:hypothetical protein